MLLISYVENLTDTVVEENYLFVLGFKNRFSCYFVVSYGLKMGEETMEL
jgi:hypothetical protein